MEAVQSPGFECVAAVTWHVGRLLRFPCRVADQIQGPRIQVLSISSDARA